MNRISLIGIGIALSLTGSVPGRAGEFRQAPENGVKDRYIVVLEKGVARNAREAEWSAEAAAAPAVADVAEGLGKRFGGTVLQVWENALTGFVVELPEGRARALARDPRVASVEQDSAVEMPTSAPVGDCGQASSTTLYDSRSLPAVSSPQSLTCDDPDPSNDSTGSGQTPRCIDNWGLDRIDQASVTRNGQYSYSRTGKSSTTQVTVFVLDGGVYGAHREFQNELGASRVLTGYDGTNGGSAGCGWTPNTDDTLANGHGTHVAAIIGGRTYGVAKRVNLVPVKIGCPDASFVTWVINGLDWIAGTSMAPAVVNWSGGNFTDWMERTSLRTAAAGVTSHGYAIIQSAGNQSGGFSSSNPNAVKDACDYTLSGITGVLVVGGSDENDKRWIRMASDPIFQTYVDAGDLGSNVGSCVGIWAPAAHIVSASKWGPQQYCRMSGTSMAAPHVAGAAALYLEAHPTATPSQLITALIAGATSNALETSSTSAVRIGSTSPNKLIYSLVP